MPLQSKPYARKNAAQLRAMSSTTPPKPSSQVASGSRVRRGQKKTGSAANRGGRPTVLTEDVKTVLLAAIAWGLAYDRAADIAGINDRTFGKWRRRGRAEEKAGLETAFTCLIRDIKRARAVFIADALDQITRACAAQWQAAFTPGRNRRFQRTARDTRNRTVGRAQ